MYNFILSREARPIPYKFILFIAMLFITIDLAAVAVSYKMVSINKLFEINSAATFIFPLTYCLGDIVAEVYGYKIARNLIWYSLFLQFVFCMFVQIAIKLPAPSFWHLNNNYYAVFGSLLRFVFAGTVANLSTNFLNIYLISRLKIPCEGKYFWARSLLSTVLAGFLMSTIIVVMGFSGSVINVNNSLIMFKSTFSLEITYALMLMLPASLIASFLKKYEKIDVYDLNINYNPFTLK